MKSPNQESAQELKRKLVFRYGSLLAASQALRISYHRMMNLLNGRTRLIDSEQDAFAAIEKKFAGQVDAGSEVR